MDIYETGLESILKSDNITMAECKKFFTELDKKIDKNDKNKKYIEKFLSEIKRYKTNHNKTPFNRIILNEDIMYVILNNNRNKKYKIIMDKKMFPKINNQYWTYNKQGNLVKNSDNVSLIYTLLKTNKKIYYKNYNKFDYRLSNISFKKNYPEYSFNRIVKGKGSSYPTLAKEFNTDSQTFRVIGRNDKNIPEKYINKLSVLLDIDTKFLYNNFNISRMDYIMSIIKNISKKEHISLCDDLDILNQVLLIAKNKNKLIIDDINYFKETFEIYKQLLLELNTNIF